MYFDEQVVDRRVKSYGLCAPAEFFAEVGAVCYGDVAHPGVGGAVCGCPPQSPYRRRWIRGDIHGRGRAPAGTGAEGSSIGASPVSTSEGRSSGEDGP